MFAFDPADERKRQALICKAPFVLTPYFMIRLPQKAFLAAEFRTVARSKKEKKKAKPRAKDGSGLF